MIKSMTGFGKAVYNTTDKRITVEIRSLNSKILNISSKIPDVYSEKELEIRNLVSKELERGKINIIITINSEKDNKVSFNSEKIKKYYNKLKKITEECGHDPKEEQVFQIIMRLPDILKIEEEELDPQEWEQIKNTVTEAIKNLDQFRIQEGNALEKDISGNIKNISEQIPGIENFEDSRIENVKSKLQQKLNDYINVKDQDKNRFEQEIIYYLEKFDINEEKIRLRNHCKYFTETINDKNAPGKKLGFIAQEIGREINTIGSKANHAEIQKIVVIMKDNLEKIKEQSLNVL